MRAHQEKPQSQWMVFSNNLQYKSYDYYESKEKTINIKKNKENQHTGC